MTNTNEKVNKNKHTAVQFSDTNYGQKNNDEVNLLELWKILSEQKKLIILFILLSTFIALILALLLPPVYRGEALLSPVPTEKNARYSGIANQFSGIAAFAGLDLNDGKKDIDTLVAILESRFFTEMFIKENNLPPVLFKELWDSDNKQWLIKDTEKPPSLYEAYLRFDNARTITIDKKTGLITLSIDWSDANQAANWVNMLIQQFNSYMKTKALEDSESKIDYLKHQLEKTGLISIQQSIFKLMEVEMKNLMLANLNEEFAFQVIDPAVAPEFRASPKRKLIMLIGIIIGLMLGVITAFIKNSVQIG